MGSKRDRRRQILADAPPPDATPPATRLIRFGSPRRAADHCSYWDAPAIFARCLECRYNVGAQGDGVRCSHRFGLDPTVVAGVVTQLRNGEIVPLDRVQD